MSVNKAILLGRLGHDPDLKYSKDGVAVTKFTMATSKKVKDANGEKTDKTQWHKIVMFDKLAEIAGEYLKKGSQVYVEGEIETSKYTDKKGVEHWQTQIIGQSMNMIGSKADNDQSQVSNKAKSAKPQQNNGFDEDESLPF